MKVLEKPTAARIHTQGVKVNIRRTMTPAKYTALRAYRITGGWRGFEYRHGGWGRYRAYRITGGGRRV